MASTLCQKSFGKLDFFVKKLEILYILDHKIRSNFASIWSKYESNNVLRDLTFSASICNGSTEKFKWQIYCKNSFSDQPFYVTITDADIRCKIQHADIA